MKPVFSIIIPVRTPTPYLKETLTHLQSLKFHQFEVLVITDKISHDPNPAVKRNLGAKMAKGKYLAFLDDDSYPDPSWLTAALNQFQQHPRLAGVCGPCLTPTTDSPSQQASGLFWSTTLGSGGAGTFRNSIQSSRFVDDFPSVNLLISKKIFHQAGGFDVHHWPGEDTLLCLNLTHKLNYRLFYHPSIIVYHHRRPVLIPHLQQITRYALHRGHFARKYPKTSFRLGYLLPSLCLLYLIASPFLLELSIYFLIPYFVYFSLLVTTFINLFLHHPLTVSTLTITTIPITHLYYGILFLIGFFKPNLGFQSHKIDPSTGQYLGG